MEENSIYDRLAQRLAEKGYVTFAPFMNWGWGGLEGRDALVKHAYALGMTPNRFEVAQLHAIVNFLQARPEVLAERIAFYGLSYGGHASLWLPACEPRLAAVVAAGHFNDWQDKLTSTEITPPLVRPTSYVTVNEGYDMFTFNVLDGLSAAPQFATRSAPRPFMVENGLRDTVTPTTWVEREFARVHAVFAWLGAPEQTEIEHFDGPHRILEGNLQFLHRHLRAPVPHTARSATMAEVGLALIGCGGNGRGHAERARQVAGVRLRAFVNLREEAARALAAANPGTYATSNVGRVWRDDAIDAVIISTHHDSHPALAVAAAEAGKHMLVEKPLALTVEACERVEAAVARAGVRLMVSFKMRFMPAVQEVFRRLPHPLLLVGQMMDNRWPDASWAQDPVTGGGNVLSQGVHNLDLLWYLARSGEPASIYAAGGTLTHRETDVIDNVFGTIRFRDGCVAALLNGDAGTTAADLQVLLRAVQRLPDGDARRRCHRARFGGAEPAEWRAEERCPDDDPEGFVQELREFVECARQNRAPTDRRDGRRRHARDAPCAGGLPLDPQQRGGAAVRAWNDTGAATASLFGPANRG